eukprot:g14512.t1
MVESEPGTDVGGMVWAPSALVASMFVLLIRMLSAGTTCVGDCDETYNYWEPLHYLLYGFGFQTWEYAPKFALRSYFYLLPSVGAARASETFLSLFGQGNDKPQIWLGVRLFHVLCCTLCEVLMYLAVKGKFGRRAGGFFLLLSATSAGMFVSAPALLPSSSSMTLFMLVMAMWLKGWFSSAILVAMLCVFGTGWPFVGIIFIPMLLNCAWLRLRRGSSFAEGLGAATASATWALTCAGAVACLATWVDSGWYGRSTSPTFNILKYNVFDAGEGRGDELYGVEPASYYVKNLFLNTSVAFPLAVALPLLAVPLYPMADKVAKSELRQKLLMCSPGLLWLAIMFVKPHKEERFLYPVYPSIFLAAACTLDIIVQAASELMEKFRGIATADGKLLPPAGAMACVLFAACLGMCRTAAVVRFHNTPCTIFKFIYYRELRTYWAGAEDSQAGEMVKPVRLCVGDEWHRYPSSFYIPHQKIEVSFLRSDFHGQLPQPFPPTNGTMAEPLQAFNDANSEEEERFVTLDKCDYVVAARYRDYDQHSTRASKVVQDILATKEKWQTVLSHKLLDPEYSDPALRAFFIPFVSERFVRHGFLSLFRRIKKCVDLPSEEVFSGFDGFEGLLLDEDEDEDDVSETESEDARAYSKVSREVRNAYHTFVSLDTAPTPELIILSKVAAALTGIPIEIVQAASRKHKEDDALLQQVGLCLTGTALEVFGGVKPSPYSSSYGGHQFGNWAGQLGDGRVCTLGEIETAQGAEGMGNGSLLEVQLKGIGQTPFSRGGDGKAVLGACLREFLFSEAFLGLGLPAAIAVSVCLTGEDATIRDTDPKNSGALKRARGAVLCRAAPSFLRFGSFELPARRGDVELVRNLADYCVRHLGSCLDPQRSLDDRYVEGERKGPKGHPVPPRKGQEEEVTMREKEDYLGLLVAIVEATARMVAGWQAVGFCHGVLNTDNFTLLGLALDFGPCSFMGRYDPCWSPNDGDSALRYSFQNQPDVAAWNCERLAEAFSSIIGVSGVARANEVFSPAFDAAYTASLEHKFGLCGMKLGSGWMHPSRSRGVAAGVTTEDAQFVLDFFRLMSSCRMDFTDTWRALLDVPTLSAARKTEQFSGAPNVHSRSDDGTELGGGRRCANGTQEEAIYGDDQEALRPLLSVLKAAGAASEQMREWAAWVREYSSRIDTQGIGKSHPDGKGDGRAARLEMMRKSSPAFVLREESLDQALKAAEMGDMSLVRRLEERLSRAYETD